MQEAEHRAFAQTDEVREFPHGRAEIVEVDYGEVGRYTFQPGWRWSNDVKPIAHTSCLGGRRFTGRHRGLVRRRQLRDSDQLTVTGADPA
jgi:hypothetical protein